MRAEKHHLTSSSNISIFKNIFVYQKALIQTFHHLFDYIITPNSKGDFELKNWL